MVFKGGKYRYQHKTCGSCWHFRTHYVERSGRFWPIRAGHCVYPRCKPRACDTPACPHWQRKMERADW